MFKRLLVCAALLCQAHAILPSTSAVKKLAPVRGGGPAAPAVASSGAYVALKTPAENFENAVALGVKKSSAPAAKILILGILAGLQVGIGAAFAVATQGGVPNIKYTDPGLAKILFGIVGLPCSLLMVMITGSELFTGNTALVGAAYFEGKVSKAQLIKSWFWSYSGNLAGGILLAALCKYAGVFSATAAEFAAVADAKASYSFGVAVARGIVCNWLVCTALWLGIAASDLASKAMAVLMVITIFAALGFEHSVANMFIGPMGAFYGSKTSLGSFLIKNLLPVTIGNIIGGSVLCSGIQHLAYGSFAKRFEGKA